MKNRFDEITSKLSVQELNDLKRSSNLAIKNLREMLENMGDFMHRIAITSGITDNSYNTIRYGLVSSYEGTVEIDVCGKKFLAIGHTSIGNANSVAKNGFIEFRPI